MSFDLLKMEEKNKKSQIKTMKIRNFQAFNLGKKAQIKTMKIRNFQAFICDRRSQIKMMETISVLLVFLILLTFVIIFYVSISKSTSGSADEESANLKTIEIAQLTSFMPEFQCSFKNIIDENCFDILKMTAFINYTQLDTSGMEALGSDYFDLFEYSKITVTEVYPDEGNEWVIYDRDPGKPQFDRKISFIPISLYRANENSYSFGMLNITVYS